MFILLLAADWLYNYWLKHGDVKGASIYLMEAFTGGRAEIESAQTSGDGGIILKGIKIQTPDGGFSAERVSARLELGSLFIGKVSVPEVSIISPSVMMAVQPARSPAVSATVEPEPMYVHAPSMRLPFVLELGPVKVDDLSIERLYPQERLKLSGIHLSAKGTVGPSGSNLIFSAVTADDAWLARERPGGQTRVIPRLIFNASIQESGEMAARADMDMVSKTVKDKRELAPTHMKMAMRATGELNGLPSGKADFVMALDGEQALDISVEASEKENGLAFAVTTRKFKLNLDRLLRVMAMRAGKVNGQADVSTLEVKGFLPGGDARKAEILMSADGHLRLYYADVAGAVLPEGGRMEVKFKDLKLSETGYTGALRISMAIPKLEKDEIAMTGAFAKLEGSLGDKQTGAQGMMDMNMFIAGVKQGALRLDGVKLTLHSLGDFLKGDLSDVQLAYAAQDGSSMRVGGSVSGYGARGIKAKGEIYAPIEKWGEWVLKETPYNISSGRIAAGFTIEGPTGAAAEDPAIMFAGNAALIKLSMDMQDGSSSLTGGGGTLRFNGKIGKGWGITRYWSQTALQAESIEIADSFRAAPVTLSLGMSTWAQDPGTRKTDFSLSVKADRVAAAGSKKEEFRDFPATFDLIATAGPGKDSYTIKTLLARLGASTAQAEGIYDGGKSQFKGDLTGTSLDLKTIYKITPPWLRQAMGIQRMGGTLSFHAAGEGTLPESMKSVGKTLPFELSGKMKIQDGSLLSKARGLEVDGATGWMDFDLGKDRARIMADIAAKRYVDKDFMGDSAGPSSFNVDMTLSAPGKLGVKKFIFNAPQMGLYQSLKGTATGAGYNSLIKLWDNPIAAIPEISINIESQTSVKAAKQTSFLPLGGVTGAFSADLSLKSVARKSLAVSGMTEFKDFTLEDEGRLIVEKLNGRVPFSKKFALVYKDNTSPAMAAEPVKPSGKDSPAPANSPAKENLTAEFLSFGPLALKNLAFDVAFKETRLSVDHFKARAMGGNMAGSLHIRGEGDGYALRTRDTFAGLNFSRLLPPAFRLSGHEAEVDGVVELGLSVPGGYGLEEPVISRMDTHMVFTRIGAKAFDNLLTFLDPEGRSPQVASARAMLKFATPERVEITARSGELSITASLRYAQQAGGKGVPLKVMEGEPIHKLAHISHIQMELAKLGPVIRLMRFVGSGALEPSADGGFSPR
ncbi:MAG: hypothetical protein HY751_11110 [Nitrospinae bacterium]|nr:hypothetical protein [Nitrospinota bacterium]